VGVIRDLTESERAEKESEIFFSLSLDLLAIAGFDGYFKRLNPAWTRTLGWSREEMLARPFSDFIHPEDMARTTSEVTKLLSEGHVTIGFENRYRHIDGSWRVLRWTAAPVPDRGLMICAARDVTEMIETQEAMKLAKDLAEETARAKSEFLATMSHEIRTPMNGVLGMLSLLAETELSVTQTDYVKTAASSGNTLLSLINDILDLSKLESGGLELERRPFDLRLLVDESVASMAMIARNKGLRLRYQIDALLPRMVVGDSLRTRQVLLNLLGNAVKFTTTGEVLVDVAVVSQAEGKVEVCLSVKDTGIGIAPESAARLFSPFAQADSSTTRKFGGTGLGLAICRRLVASMGGTIDFESSQGQGTVFRVLVQWPVAGVDDVVPGTPGPTVLPMPSPGLRVLVVEDNLVNQKVLVAMLTKYGVACDVAIDGAKGVEAVRQNKYALVFMDCQMPEMDGYTATRLIRSEVPGGNDVPIVALTANVLSGERELCLAAGMNGYLSKPVSREDLLSVLQTFTGQPRSPN
jgi:PAS domain S-box-containing protein